MPKYQVLTPIEHNGTLYIPKMENAPKTAPTSGSKPMLVAVDAGGVIDLNEQEVAPMAHGQVPLHQGKPDPIGGKEERAEKAAFEKKQAEDKAAAEAAEFAEFQAYKAAKAAQAAKGKKS